jgi:hypothetical protein
MGTAGVAQLQLTLAAGVPVLVSQPDSDSAIVAAAIARTVRIVRSVALLSVRLWNRRYRRGPAFAEGG